MKVVTFERNGVRSYGILENDRVLDVGNRLASRYADLVPDAAVRDAIYPRLANEHRRTVRWLLEITRRENLLDDNPTLARSIRNRFPYLDPLNHVQIELLRRYRSGQTDVRTKRGIHLTINGLAAGLRNSG